MNRDSAAEEILTIDGIVAKILFMAMAELFLAI
jgi:hypothetical protein